MDYRCNICNKKYSSYQSLWIHNKKYHTDGGLPKTGKNNNCKYRCEYCDISFTRKNNMNVHINKRCKGKANPNSSIINNNTTNNINKGNIVNNTNNNINKGQIINNTNIIKFGTEDIMKILTDSQTMHILSSRVQALEESIKTIHFNENLPEYQNIRINNLRSNVAMIHDGKNFTATNQYSAIDELINNHLDIITHLLDENKDKLSDLTIDRLTKFIDKMDDEYSKMVDHSTNRQFKNYRDFIGKVGIII